MKLPFEWHQLGEVKKGDEIVLEIKTIGMVVALMASAMVAVVRSAAQTEEAADER